MIGKVKSWLESRTGLSSSIRERGQRPLTGGPSWARSLGPMLMALIGLEFVTGIAMAFFYSPSTTDAWASIVFLETEVSLGALVRSVHYWGMDAIIVVAVLHLLTSLVRGGYKDKREVTWLLGIGTLLILIGFSLTGFILAYDAKGLAANTVETEIMRSMPLVGPIQREALIGGNEYGNLSLTRFYALHVFVLPGLLIALVAAHVALVRKHGPVPGWWLTPEAAAAKSAPWWPGQAFRDAVGGAIGVAVVMAIAAAQKAPLRAPADPAGSFDARPEWYFMPLFELRKTFTGSSEIIATAILPGIAIAFLAAIPFIDRGSALGPKRRLKVLVPAALIFAVAGVFTWLGLAADKANADHQKSMADADTEAARALELAAMGGVPLDPLRLIENDPNAWGAKLFDEQCASCHSLGTGEGSGPDLAGWGGRAWTERFLADPNHPHLYGGTELACKMDGLEAYGVDDEEDIKAIVDGLLANRGAHAPAGLPEGATGSFAEVFGDNGCKACHRLSVGDEDLGSVDGSGPDLTTYGSPEWFDALLLFPDHGAQYGKLNDMPSFAPDLDRAERAAIRAYVFGLATRPLSPQPTEEELAKASCSAPSDAVTPAPDGDQGDPPQPDATPAATTVTWESGKALFDDRCASCHVVGGAGTDTGPELTGWGSRDWLKAFLVEPDHGRLYGGTDLEGDMPPAADLGLEDKEDIEFLVDAILVPRNGSSALESAVSERALEIFDDASCGSCHRLAFGEDEIGSADGSGPDLTGWGSAAWLHGLLQEPDAEAYYGDNNAMPPFANLSPDELQGLTLYMMSLANQPLPADLAATAARAGEE